MKKIVLSLVSILIILNSANAVTYNSEPKIFISELVADAIKTLSDKSKSKENKRKIIEKIALENVDIKALGYYTLGSIKKNLKPEELDKYNNLFEKYLLKSLTSRLTDYSSNNFEVLSSEQKSSNTTIVKSKILESSSSPEININWRIYTKNPTKPLIRDLIVEGLSMARVQKEEFGSILSSNNNNINALFKKLENFISN
ncbi:ABC transporter substrate-binding protein [Pelagibacteraceae bacterium]|nr:ABC transporter substrate-binding protein [Pelagibacteraceae bacterium]